MKAFSKQPNVWHVIVTLFAMLYLASFTSGLAQVTFNSPDFTINALILRLLIAFAWCFLILDLIKQVSLFFQKRAK